MSGAAQTLPTRFPIFPLRGALLLPAGNLPLNIFEPRYLAMIRDAMNTHKVIGMVQTRTEGDVAPRPEVFLVGCAGRISNFSETEDGRYLIVLSGVCRFTIAQELDVTTPYRQVLADFEPWRGDLSPVDPPEALRDRLLRSLAAYFEVQDMQADWSQLEDAPLSSLVTAMAMICPFDASEKQAILEARTLADQAELLTTLIQMASLAGSDGNSERRH